MEELQINKFDSVSKIDKLKKIDNFFKSKQTDFKQKLEVSFNGLSNDDIFEFQFTDNGFIAKGKGSINQKTETNKKDSISNNKVDESLKENSTVQKNEINQNTVDESKLKIDKNKQNQSTGFNWNFTIVIIVGVIVSLVLLWKFGLPKIKSK